MWKNFKTYNLCCECCGLNGISISFIDKLQRSREIAKVKFVITSGYRCEIHNKKEGGSATSSHLIGLAVDIKAETYGMRFKILASLIYVGFNRIGIHKDFIHVDDDADKTQGVLWLY
ncbi:peptidase M15 [Candidatus Pacearchaeota archaeon]|nr:peptidase M15 [Candidatus Pacearchaeota archaeon]